MPIRDVV